MKDKITKSIFSQFAFNHLQMTQTQKIITHRVSKIHKWIWEHGYEWGKFSKPWQVTDKLLSDFLFTIHIFILWMTQTQEIITRRVLKIHEWIWGDVYEWGKVSWTMINERLGPGQHGARPKWVGPTRVGPKQVGQRWVGPTPATQSRKFENKSNKTRI